MLFAGMPLQSVSWCRDYCQEAATEYLYFWYDICMDWFEYCYEDEGNDYYECLDDYEDCTDNAVDAYYAFFDQCMDQCLD